MRFHTVEFLNFKPNPTQNQSISQTGDGDGDGDDFSSEFSALPSFNKLQGRLYLSMVKRRVKKATKQQDSSLADLKGGRHPEDSSTQNGFDDREVERQIAAIRTIRDVETERLLTGVRLLRSNFSKEQQQIPLLQFFKENLPNLALTRNGNGEYEVQWKDSNLSINTAERGNIHTSLLHHMSMIYPECPTEMPSFGGFEVSSKTVKESFCTDNIQIGDLVLEEPFESRLRGLQDSLRTPGATSHRLSVGMTPKTLRLPKRGEMLLSVHGSPLGIYKEENMEAIHETMEE